MSPDMGDSQPPPEAPPAVEPSRKKYTWVDLATPSHALHKRKLIEAPTSSSISNKRQKEKEKDGPLPRFWSSQPEQRSVSPAGPARSRHYTPSPPPSRRDFFDMSAPTKVRLTLNGFVKAGSQAITRVSTHATEGLGTPPAIVPADAPARCDCRICTRSINAGHSIRKPPRQMAATEVQDTGPKGWSVVKNPIAKATAAKVMAKAKQMAALKRRDSVPAVSPASKGPTIKITPVPKEPTKANPLDYAEDDDTDDSSLTSDGDSRSKTSSAKLSRTSDGPDMTKELEKHQGNVNHIYERAFEVAKNKMTKAVRTEALLETINKAETMRVELLRRSLLAKAADDDRSEYLLRQSHHLNQIVQGYKSKLRMHDPAAAWIAFSDEDKDGEDEWEEEEQEEEEEEEAGSGYSYDA